VDEETRRARIASNESVFRQLNEKIEGLNEAFGPMAGSMTAICECGDPHCVEQIDVELELYERVRADPTLFIVATGHDIEDVEDIVANHEGFDVVCKHKGAGKTVAEATDPRR
jgi:hypothetical protein